MTSSISDWLADLVWINRTQINELKKKELLSKQVSLDIYSLLQKISTNPTALGCQASNSVPLSPECSQISIETAPKSTKRLPVTRKDDFLWEI